MPDVFHHEDCRVQRDLFPLPVAFETCRALSKGLSRSLVRRLKRTDAQRWEVQNTAASLNALFDGWDIHHDRSSFASSLHPMSAAQQKVFEFIVQSLHELGPIPDGLDGPGALEMLRASGDYGSDQNPASLGSYDPGKLSLPEAGNVPVPLDTLWGQNGCEFVGSFVNSITMPEKEARARVAASGVRACYSDPLLRHPKTFASLVKRLHACGLVSFSTVKPKCNTELFFVKKKSGLLRMVVDCRHSNCFFQDPLGVSLATGDALSRIELEPEGELCFASADLKDAFYHLELPEALRPYFGLRGVRACDIGLNQISGQAVQWNQVVYPQLSAVPMGWTWALWLCQTLHERIVGLAGADDSFRLSDKKPAPSTAVLHTEYVDNFHVFGTDKQRVSEISQAGIERLRSVGLIVHEEEESVGSANVLGWEFTGSGILKPSRKRLWKVRLAIQEILKRGSISGRQLERVVGHMSFISMGRREGLSILGDTYTFIRRFYTVQHKLWRSVRRELAVWYGISPLLWKDLRAPWSDTVHATDASEWGCGATVAKVPIEHVREAGKFSERWRFGDPAMAKPRNTVVSDLVAQSVDEHYEAEVFHPGGSDIGQWGNNSKPVFTPLPFEVVNRPWTVVCRYRWKRQESMPILEARSTLFAVKHIARFIANFGHRHLLFSDSMTAISGISKGRANARGLRRVTQQIAAICLSSRLAIHVRWLPSEWNPADSPSRGGYSASVPTRCIDSHDGDSSVASRGGDLSFRSTVDAKVGEADNGEETVNESRSSEKKADREEKPDSRHPRCQHDHLDASSCPASNSGDIQTSLDRLQHLVSRPATRNQQPCRNRSESEPLYGRNVPRRLRPQLRTLCTGGDDFLPPRAQVTENAGVAKVQAEHARLAEPHASSGKTAYSLGSHVSDRSMGAQARDGSNGSGIVAGVCDVFETIGTVPDPCERCGHSGQVPSTQAQASGGDIASLRRRHPVKDTRVRRNDHFGPASPQVFGAGDKRHDPANAVVSQPAFVWTGHQPASRLYERGADHTAASEVGYNAPLPTEAWRSILRPVGAPSQPRRDHETRSMAGNAVRPTLRKGWPSGSADVRTAQRCSTTGPMGSRKHRRPLQQPALAQAPSIECPMFLEIFSGSGNLSKAVVRVCHWSCGTFDILQGSEYDLRSGRNQRLVKGWIRSGLVKSVHLGMPCNSFSHARDRRPGPPPLRSDEHPMGLDSLRPSDELKVREGNMFLRFCCQVCHLCILLHIPFILENPATSRAWLCPPLQAVMRKKGVSFVDVDYCAFGTRWRKRTRFLFYGVDLSHLAVYKCQGSKRGVCKFSGLPHLALMGVNEAGQFMTKVAEPYPPQLCVLIARALLDWHTKTIADNFWSRLWPDGAAKMGK